MLGSGFISQTVLWYAFASQASRTQVDVFDNLYLAYIALGTLVGIVVVSYTVYNAYKYRISDTQPSVEDSDVDEGAFQEEGSTDTKDDVARPRLGELPTGDAAGKGGKKLFLSFGISAIIVIGLIIYAYSLLLYVEGAPAEHEDALEIEVVGFQFDWEYTYPNGHTTNELVVPKDQVVVVEVTSTDVMHNWGVPEFRAKTDAIPGQTTTTWFQAEETGEYEAICYELCGAGHSDMIGDVTVMEPDEYEEWYEDTEGDS